MTESNAAAPRVVVHPTKQLLSDAIGARLLTALVDVQAARGEVSLVLTGGSLGSAVLASLGALPGRDAVDWSRVDLWWGDERFLPQGDPERNETQNREALLDALPLDPARVRAMPGPDGPDGDDVAAAAARYAGWLADAAGVDAAGGVQSPTFDILLLGVGPDAHVASLFPGHPDQLTAGVAAAPVHDSPKPPPTRITLTFEALNRADRVWFIVAGADKADAVAVSVAGAPPQESSAAQVHGIQETLWLVDVDAASSLPR
ncbi:MAG TPA: 6-phosphogluconolactonase [Pedococcus sp.]|nr:6-phosphogluconolactonase [Pedococcus sp.]